MNLSRIKSSDIYLDEKIFQSASAATLNTLSDFARSSGIPFYMTEEGIGFLAQLPPEKQSAWNALSNGNRIQSIPRQRLNLPPEHALLQHISEVMLQCGEARSIAVISPDRALQNDLQVIAGTGTYANRYQMHDLWILNERLESVYHFGESMELSPQSAENPAVIPSPVAGNQPVPSPFARIVPFGVPLKAESPVDHTRVGAEILSAPVLTPIPAETIEMPPVSTDTNLTYGANKTITLGKELGEGTESRVFEIVGMDNAVVKIFNSQVTRRKFAKLHEICSVKPVLRHVVLPLEIVMTSDGTECGYIMRRVSSGSSLGQCLPQWTSRADLVMAARSYLEILQSLRKVGIILTDANPQNILVEYDIDHYCRGDGLTFIDLDSAQMMLSDHTVIPGDGSFPDFWPAGALPLNPDTILTEEEADYMAALFSFYILMRGIHPFRSIRDESYPDASWQSGANRNLFGYGTEACPAANVRVSEDWTKRWSWMPDSTRKMFADIFRCGKKVKLAELLENINDYYNRITSRGVPQEALKIKPETARSDPF